MLRTNEKGNVVLYPYTREKLLEEFDITNKSTLWHKLNKSKELALLERAYELEKEYESKLRKILGKES